jgi:hypothetical protein
MSDFFYTFAPMKTPLTVPDQAREFLKAANKLSPPDGFEKSPEYNTTEYLLEVLSLETKTRRLLTSLENKDQQAVDLIQKFSSDQIQNHTDKIRVILKTLIYLVNRKR